MSGDLILVGNDKGGTITALRLEGESLVEVATTEVGVGCSTFAIDAARGLVYCAVREPSPAVVTLALDPETAALTEVDRLHVDDPLAYIAASANALLVASYHGGWGASWQLVDGRIGAPRCHFDHRNMHASIADRRGENAYFASLGDDLVAQFALATDGELVELSSPVVKVEPGAGPRHLVISDDGRNVYLLTEFTGQAIRFDRSEGGRLHREEDVQAFDASTGLGRSAYGRDPRADHLIWGADLAIAGRWLLCSERTESTVAAIELAPDGRLTENVVISKVEAQPRGLTVAPDGQHVVVVGERSDHAGLYRLEDDGRLVEVDRIRTGTGPNWVRFVV